LSAAEKMNVCEPDDYQNAIETMVQNNSFGSLLSIYENVSAMTDLTGFGMLGHAMEMTNETSLELEFEAILKLPNLDKYIAKMTVPSATYRNWNSVSANVNKLDANKLITLCDPQTSGGLLVAINPSFKAEFEQLLVANKLEIHTKPIGRFIEKREEKIVVV
jgi:selenide,water dikinase